MDSRQEQALLAIERATFVSRKNREKLRTFVKKLFCGVYIHKLMKQYYS